MSYKIWNQTNAKREKTKKRVLNVNSRSGVFSFSQGLAEALHLEDGDGVELVQSEAEKGKWFIYRSGKSFAFKVKAKNNPKHNGAFFFSNKVLADVFVESMEANRSVSVQVKPEPVKVLQCMALEIIAEQNGNGHE